MVRKRALADGEQVEVNGRLPLLYSGLAPLNPAQHGDLFISVERDYQFASEVNAVPITADEFTQVARHYPIVFSLGAAATPVALVGFENGRNDQVDADGGWAEGRYVPAWLRRFPFLLLRENEQTDRKILCADLSSTLFQTEAEGGQPLFDEAGEPGTVLTTALDFCNRFEASMARTEAMMRELVELDLMQASSVSIKRGEQNARIDGFSMVSEEKLRALEDAPLAALARRGVLTLIAAHHISVTNFSQMEMGA